MATEPKTLQEAIIDFSNPDNCVAYMVSKRWPDGTVRCPNCDTTEVKYMAKRRVWQCKNRHPKHQFSVKVGTIYEDSAICLDKWLTATWLITNCKNGISSYEIARAIGVTQKSAWFMDHRIRTSMTDHNFAPFKNPTEADETGIGGLAKNMHVGKRRRRITGTGYANKTTVMGLLERGGKVKNLVIQDRSAMTLQSVILDCVEPGTPIFTDELPAYRGLDGAYIHNFINHAETYVRGQIHTNGLENYWSLLKRGLKGTYVSVHPDHLGRYLDEQVFRYNNRKVKDATRFNLCVSQSVGRRLTYKELTGKDKATPKGMA